MGVLLGTLIAMGRLSTDLEITALRACGVSLYRVFAPFFVVGVLLSGLTLLGSERLVPYCKGRLLELQNDVKAGRSGQLKQQRATWPIKEGGELRWLLIAEQVEGSLLRGVKLFYFDPDVEHRHTAEDELGNVYLAAGEAHFNGGGWTFYEVRRIQLEVGDEGPVRTILDVEQTALPGFTITPEALATLPKAPEDLSTGEVAQVVSALMQQSEYILTDKELLGLLMEVNGAPQAGGWRGIAPARSGEAPQQRLVWPIREQDELRWVLIAQEAEEALLREVKLFSFGSQSGKRGVVEDDYNDFFVTADHARWVGNSWAFTNMKLVKLQAGEEGTERLILEADEYTLPDFSITPESLALRTKKPENLTIVQLRNLISDLLEKNEYKLTANEILDLHTKLYFKYSIPLTPLFFIFIAFPLAIIPQRSTRTMGMGLTLLVILGYYVMYTTGLRLGAAGVLPPVVAAWLPNALLLATGLVLLRRRERN
jgi:lipopolysaccharide export LptBFGC system permease protein LptF